MALPGFESWKSAYQVHIIINLGYGADIDSSICLFELIEKLIWSMSVKIVTILCQLELSREIEEDTVLNIDST